MNSCISFSVPNLLIISTAARSATETKYHRRNTSTTNIKEEIDILRILNMIHNNFMTFIPLLPLMVSVL
jgi:hypothetical protein